MSIIRFLFIFVFSLSFSFVSASYTTKLDDIERKILSIYEKLEKKGYNSDIFQKEKKLIHEKVTYYKSLLSKNERKDIFIKATKEIVLRAVAGITKYEDFSNLIYEKSHSNLDKIKKILKSSVSKGKYYRLYIKAKYKKDYIYNYLSKFDYRIRVYHLDFKDDLYNYFKIEVPNDSVLVDTILFYINEDLFPKKLLKFSIIEPKLFKSISYGSYISGEVNLWGMNLINASKYQEFLNKSGKIIKIGVLDTGIDKNHLDLKDNIYINPNEKNNGIDDDNNGYVDDIWGYDFVYNDSDPMDGHYHGTHVAGTIGAIVNGKGVYGVNSKAKLVALKVLSDGGLGSSYDIVEAIKYAADNDIKVINLSLGGIGNPSSSIICKAIDYAYRKGTITVVAAGNSNKNVNRYVPAGCKNVITVASINKKLEKSYFSNYGTGVDISAPGEDIYSTAPGGKYYTLAGTSMASPHIAGIVSIILEFSNKNLNLDDIKNILKYKALPTYYSSSNLIGPVPNLEYIFEKLSIDTSLPDDKKDNTAPSINLTLDDDILNISIIEDNADITEVSYLINGKKIKIITGLNSKLYNDSLNLSNFISKGIIKEGENIIKIESKNKIGLKSFKKLVYIYNKPTPIKSKLLLKGLNYSYSDLDKNNKLSIGDELNFGVSIEGTGEILLGYSLEKIGNSNVLKASGNMHLKSSGNILLIKGFKPKETGKYVFIVIPDNNLSKKKQLELDVNSSLIKKIDKTPPVLVTSFNKKSLLFTISSLDNESELDNVSVVLNGKRILFASGLSNNFVKSLYFEENDLTGENIILTKVTNKAGLEISKEEKFFFNKEDKTAPIIEDVKIMSYNKKFLKVLVKDLESGVKYVRLYINGKLEEERFINGKISTNQTFLLRSLKIGNNKIKIEGENMIGLKKFIEKTIYLSKEEKNKIPKDTTSPNSSINLYPNSGNVRVNIYVSEFESKLKSITLFLNNNILFQKNLDTIRFTTGFNLKLDISKDNIFKLKVENTDGLKSEKNVKILSSNKKDETAPILTGKILSYFNGKKVFLKVNILEEQTPLKKLDIFINGNKFNSRNLYGFESRQTFIITGLNLGENTITVKALNKLGLESKLDIKYINKYVESFEK